MKISRKSSLAQNVTNKKTKNMECTNCLGNIITNAACCTCEIKKPAFNKNTFHQNFT